MKAKTTKIIFSAGGTGGHIYPALATADALRKLIPDTEILFIGAEGKMEMDKVPHHGYNIIGLPIQGLKRSFSLKNLAIPYKIICSLRKAKKILKEFKPDLVAGFGGFASGPVLKMAAKMKIPTLLQEQNSFPGLTNRILAKKASVICTAYPEMEKYFTNSKICFVGNPIRNEIYDQNISQIDARNFLRLDTKKTTILAIGGSLGALTINQSICNLIPEIIKKDYQVIWQTGKNYSYHHCHNYTADKHNSIFVQEFIFEMQHAYAAADIIISRAGAIAVSEICTVAKPAIFIPSPNVTDDHQTKNAMALVKRNAAILIKDNEANETLANTLFELIENTEKQKDLVENIKTFAKIDAATKIAKIIIETINKENGNK